MDFDHAFANALGGMILTDVSNKFSDSRNYQYIIYFKMLETTFCLPSACLVEVGLAAGLVDMMKPPSSVQPLAWVLAPYPRSHF